MTQTQWGKAPVITVDMRKRGIAQWKLIINAMNAHFGADYQYSTKQEFFHDLGIVVNQLSQVQSQLSRQYNVSESVARLMLGLMCMQHYMADTEERAKAFFEEMARTRPWGASSPKYPTNLTNLTTSMGEGI